MKVRAELYASREYDADSPEPEWDFWRSNPAALIEAADVIDVEVTVVG